MDTYEDEAFIRDNIPELLATPEMKAKTNEVGGCWKLLDFSHIGSRARNIKFTASFENGASYWLVSGKINRDSGKFSNIEIAEN